MEDNHAISKQPNAVNYEEEYNKLLDAYTKLEDTAKHLYNRTKQLKNTWMLQRADFLFKVVENNKFDPDIRQKAQIELENFLFPVQQDVENKEA